MMTLLQRTSSPY